MTDDELRAWAHEVVERSTKAQGLPYHVEDEATLRQICLLLATHRKYSEAPERVTDPAEIKAV